ncbi:MAG: polysaccharide biosynthesis/export family protein [Polyangiaceae bacterium]
MKLRGFSLWALSLSTALTLFGCGSSIHYDYSQEYDPRKHEYVIGASDTLQINVWQNNDLSTSALVRPDGTITMPLIGDLQVAGKTPTQVRGEITAKLAKFVKAEAAIVTVAVSAVASYRFTVTGQVQNPGTFNSNYYVTVAEAVAMAGGPTRFADTGSVELVRVATDGKTRRIPINYDDIADRKHPEANLTLVAGDTVFVP